jgi:ABC-2 type transport system ATP-binding protein
METVLSVENLSKTFTVRQKPPGFMPSVRALFKAQKKEVRAVDSISFSVERGEMLAFIGPNGAGKSTTIKLVTGILYPTTGSIRVLGLDPHKQRKALARRIGTVFGQRSQLWYHLPPLDTMLLLADIYDLDRAKAKARIDKLVDLFGIKEYLKTPVRKLSLGERVRCEIAASLLHSPEVLFLDEPTIGLDVVVRQVVRDLIRRMNEEERTTVFLTSHDTGDIEKICRRAIVINHGRIVWDGTIKDMKYRLLRRKVIDLKLDAPLKLEAEGVEVLKSRPYSAKLAVDLCKASLDQVVSLIMRDNKVEDITITNPPMEEIITMIYSRTGMSEGGGAMDGGSRRGEAGAGAGEGGPP